MKMTKAQTIEARREKRERRKIGRYLKTELTGLSDKMKNIGLRENKGSSQILVLSNLKEVQSPR
jgi:hypothetical protein